METEVKRKVKILWTIEVEVCKQPTNFDFWIRFVDQPHMAINLGHIPLLERLDVNLGDRLALSLDLEPRNARTDGHGTSSVVEGREEDARVL